MAHEISVVFKAKDELSSVVDGMQKKVEGLDKVVKDYQATQSKIFGKAIEIKVDIEQAKKGLKDLDKMMEENAKNRQNSFKETNTKGIPKEFKELGKDLEKTIGAGIGQEINSVLGESLGSKINNVAGGAINGAVTGLSFGIWGAVAGLLIGGITGVIKSATEEKKKQDDLFKEEVKGLFEQIKSDRKQSMEAGKVSAAQKEEEEVLKNNPQDKKNTYQSLLKELNVVKSEIDEAMGKGYIEERKKGIKEEIEFYNGEAGEKLKTINILIGKQQATLENKEQESIIKSLGNVLDGVTIEQIQNTKDVGALQTSVDAATIKGEIEYKNSEDYKKEVDRDFNLVGTIQNDLKDGGQYLDYGAKLADAFTKGWGIRLNESFQAVTEEVVDKALIKMQSAMIVAPDSGRKRDKQDEMISSKPKMYATGLKRVPYDGMPATLHEGERILTKIEANKLDRKKDAIPSNIQITVYNNSGNSYEITQEICNQIMRASENYVGGVA